MLHLPLSSKDRIRKSGVRDSPTKPAEGYMYSSYRRVSSHQLYSGPQGPVKPHRANICLTRGANRGRIPLGTGELRCQEMCQQTDDMVM